MIKLNMKKLIDSFQYKKLINIFVFWFNSYKSQVYGEPGLISREDLVHI